MDRAQAIKLILDANEADLALFSEAVVLRRNSLATKLKRSLAVGDTVKFTSAKKRSPYTYTAVITDKRQTRATVRITGPTWGKYKVGSLVTVPFAMLSEA